MRQKIAVRRDHQLMYVKEHPNNEIRKTGGRHGPWDHLNPNRSVGIEEWSMMVGTELQTIFIAIDFLDIWHNTILDTRGFDNPVEAVLDHLDNLKDNDGNWIYSEHNKPSNTKLRKEYNRDDPNDGGRRPGFRKLPKPVVLAAHRWDLLLGRLFRNNPQMRKSVKAMEEGTTIYAGSWRLEIIKNFPGGDSANFHILAFKEDRVIRLIGRSIKGQSPTATPIQNAEAYLGRNDLEIPHDSWRKKQYSSLSSDEIETLKSFVATSANIARELYERMAEYDRAISPYVTRRDGTHPPSVASAAMRIALSYLDVPSFEKPPWRVQQIGALGAAGGNVRMYGKSGYYEHLYLYDGDLWYGHLMAQPPICFQGMYAEM